MKNAIILFLMFSVVFLVSWKVGKMPISESHLVKGNKYMLENEFEKAIEEYKIAAEEEDNKAMTLVGIGNVYLLLGDIEKANAYFDKALALNPNSLMILQSKLAGSTFSGDYEAAKGEATKMMQISPNNWIAFFNRCSINNQLLDYKAALKDLDRANELVPSNITILYNRASLKSSLEDLSGSQKDLEKIYQLKPSYISTYLMGGIAYKQQDIPKSIEYFKETIKLNPNFTDAYYHRAVAYFSLKEYENALADFEKVRELDREMKHILFYQAICEYTLGDKELACEHFYEAKEEGEEQADKYITTYCED